VDCNILIRPFTNASPQEEKEGRTVCGELPLLTEGRRRDPGNQLSHIGHKRFIVDWSMYFSIPGKKEKRGTDCLDPTKKERGAARGRKNRYRGPTFASRRNCIEREGKKKSKTMFRKGDEKRGSRFLA